MKYHILMKVVALYIVLGGGIAFALYYSIKSSFAFASVITSLIFIHLITALYSSMDRDENSDEIIKSIKGTKNNE